MRAPVYLCLHAICEFVCPFSSVPQAAARALVQVGNVILHCSDGVDLGVSNIAQGCVSCDCGLNGGQKRERACDKLDVQGRGL
eukprot:10408012-Alexandrium_andersonii.AAC.1